MAKGRRPYPKEFRERIVEMARMGRSPYSLAKEFEPTEKAIRKWVRQADLDEGLRSDGATSSELEEIRRLKRRVRQLEEEREILSKAATWFAREADSTSNGSSNS